MCSEIEKKNLPACFGDERKPGFRSCPKQCQVKDCGFRTTKRVV